MIRHRSGDAAMNLCSPQDADDPLLRRPDTIEGLIFTLPKEWRYGETVPTVRPHRNASYAIMHLIYEILL